jgi:hypothetical protein
MCSSLSICVCVCVCVCELIICVHLYLFVYVCVCVCVGSFSLFVCACVGWCEEGDFHGSGEGQVPHLRDGCQPRQVHARHDLRLLRQVLYFVYVWCGCVRLYTFGNVSCV